MTTNARDEKWSEWIDWNGDAPEFGEDTTIQWISNDGRSGECLFGDLMFGNFGGNYAIKKYRYKIKEPDSGIADPEEEECIQLAYERMNEESVPVSIKQLRYMDNKGEDWIDEFARTATIDEFRGAMRFTIGKYNRRAGKKDELVKEIEKMRDYCDRWIAYEKERA